MRRLKAHELGYRMIFHTPRKSRINAFKFLNLLRFPHIFVGISSNQKREYDNLLLYQSVSVAQKIANVYWKCQSNPSKPALGLDLWRKQIHVTHTRGPANKTSYKVGLWLDMLIYQLRNVKSIGCGFNATGFKLSYVLALRQHRPRWNLQNCW
jgi:hypothetical protein